MSESLENITLRTRLSQVVNPIWIKDEHTNLSNDYAAVVIVLRVKEETGVDCLFVRRRSSEQDPWSGQVAFPGGRWSPVDSSLLATASRELYEETGLEVGRDVEMLGYLGDVSPRNAPNLKVRPYVALLKNNAAVVKKGEEVHSVMWINLNNLKRRVVKIYAKRIEKEFTTVGYLLEPDTVIWGLTARVLSWIIDALEPIAVINKR